MLRYDLDRLGWKDFEHLIKTLIKAKLGSGVEICSSLHDGGREAYHEGSLPYPIGAGARLQRGPFVFQCKFVDSGNAAGSKGANLLWQSTKEEAAMIEERLAGKRNFPWKKIPSHYALFTNVDVNAVWTKKIRAELNSVMPSASVHIHNGSDVCAWIDSIPDITIRFPQLFSMADFTQLLENELRHEAHTRSSIALNLAKRVATSFVATKPYQEALAKLHQHLFVVLEGPPEMGKTSIARMLALAHYRDGWEAIECPDPSDVVAQLKYKSDSKQIFLADDCFGSTDYQPERVGAWQKQLPYILSRLDKSHLLVLTCRAHLWERGKRHLSTSGQLPHFPEIGEVVVNAAELPEGDKARILYRHAKQANLPEPLRKALREWAPSIVKNPHFTPERIRLYIHDLAANSS